MSLSALENDILARTQLLVGPDALSAITSARVILFGVGGVGSWCAEALLRTGIRHLTLVDSDVVALSNCNRQLPALPATIGLPKVEVLRERLLAINPHAHVTAIQGIYSRSTAASFHLEDYDYVIDAIDSLQDKADLILHATSIPSLRLFSSMGAALRINPLLIREAEFWQVKGDALARALRNKFKRAQTFPARKFRCIYSEEQPLPNLGSLALQDVGDAGSTPKAQTNGSLAPVTGAFGLALASLLLRDITARCQA